MWEKKNKLKALSCSVTVNCPESKPVPAPWNGVQSSADAPPPLVKKPTHTIRPGGTSGPAGPIFQPVMASAVCSHITMCLCVYMFYVLAESN